MLLELARPIGFAMCLVSLCAVFNTAFLYPVGGLDQSMGDLTLLVSLAGGIAWSSGMLFREASEVGIGSILRTLPMRVFCWTVGAMALLFAASLYLESQGVFYRDLRRF